MPTAAPDQEATTPPKRSRTRKLIMVAGVAVVMLLGAAGAGAYYLKKKQDAQAEAENGQAETAAKKASTEPPVYVPLESFTVNLADRGAERFVQLSLSLQVEDKKAGERVRAFMPAVRHAMLLALSRKTAADLSSHEGKLALARELHLATLQAMQVDLPAAAPAATAPAAAGSAVAPAATVSQAPAAWPTEGLPVVAVHFGNFIIQ